MPRTKKENARHRAKTAENLLQAALKVFERRGYQASSMAAIALAAGVSKGLTYHYFKSKEALLVALAEKRLGEWLPLVEGLETIVEPAYRLSFLINFVLLELQQKTDTLRFYNTLYLCSDGCKAIAKAMRKFQAQFQRLFNAEIQLFVDLGFPDPELEATFLRSTLQGISLEYMLQPKDYPLIEMREKLIQRYAYEKRTL